MNARHLLGESFTSAERAAPRDHRDLAADMAAIQKSSADAVNADRRLEDEIRAENDAALGSVPIAGDIVSLRNALEQRSSLTELELTQLGHLCREWIERVQSKHYRRVTDLDTLVNILTCIGVDPQVEDGRVEVACMAASEMMNIGALLTEQYPREAASVIEASRYDAVRFVVWWDAKRLVVEREAA